MKVICEKLCSFHLELMDDYDDDDNHSNKLRASSVLTVYDCSYCIKFQFLVIFKL